MAVALCRRVNAGYGIHSTPLVLDVDAKKKSMTDTTENRTHQQELLLLILLVEEKLVLSETLSDARA